MSYRNEKRPVPKKRLVSKVYLVTYDSGSIRYIQLNKTMLSIETSAELHNLNKRFDHIHHILFFLSVF